ncbi:MAG TPA: divergent polysaccharide deacetylase family protein [Candidatus Acidoferrum sp.]|nr:divergent polysaccharide deacetylase family protein [Candidatus Acidoferrum sp.]
MVSAAQQATGRKSEIAIRPEIRQSSNGEKSRLAADDIYISLRDPSEAGAIRQALVGVAERHDLSFVETSSAGVTRFDFLSNGTRTHTVHLITPLPVRSHPAAPHPQGAAELAIIVDDLGHDRASADSLLALPFPITVSVLPQLAFSSEVAEEAYRRGDQVMLHLPMESLSEGAPSEGAMPEPIELRVGMDRSRVASVVDAMLETVPHAAGVNNHQGSRATADPALMQALMPVLRERNLFFIDSRTTAATVAYDSAENAGVRAASRKVFLDDTQTREAILAQLDLAARDALRDGSAIAIGHPHPATIAALADCVPSLEGRGIRLVFASDLAH